MIRVLLADDQPLIRAGLRGLVELEPDLTVVAEAGDGREAVRLAREGVDVVVMDVRMPGMDGIEATSRICADPALSDVHVLVLTTFETDEHVARALRAGAAGFLGKGADPRALVDAIRVVARGEALLSPVATRSLIEQFLSAPAGDRAPRGDDLHGLTEREREVLGLVGEGLSNEQIADRLVISPLTVKTHVNRTMTKLDAHDRAQLVVLAYESGLLRPR